MTAIYAVTGVASGIGAALARILKRNGDTVIGFDLRETTDNVDDFIPLDLGDRAAVARAAETVRWPLDGLCNNAGLPPRPGLESAILQVNFLNQRSFTEAMLAHLKPGASIVNMASRAGQAWLTNIEQIKRLAALARPEEVDAFVLDEGIDAARCYNLSKEAMIAWTMAITEDLLRHDIRVNTLSPGGIATGILDDFKRVFGETMARNVERAGRPGNPEEVARIAAFLLSPASNWLKGADIPIDGGMGAFNLADRLELDALKPRNAGASG